MADFERDSRVARCPTAPSTQEIVHRDGRPVPAVMASESYRYFGDEDIAVDRYVSLDFQRDEHARLWSRTWQWACREEHIPEVGDYHVYEIGDQSILVVRTAAGVRAYVNSCLHRATKLRPGESYGNATALRCPYHGWTWSLEGALIRLPCAWDFPQVDPAEFHLPEVRVELWEGFVFINLDPDAPALEAYMRPIQQHFEHWHFADRRIYVHVQKELHANWKIALHAVLENYHTQETHPQLLFGNADENTQYDVYGDHVSRFYSVIGFTSPHLDTPLSEQELVNRSMLTNSELPTDALRLRPGETARLLLARESRRHLEAVYGNLSAVSDTEIIDSLQYYLFPNTMLFPTLSLPMAYRVRPLNGDPDKSLFELFMFRPAGKDDVEPPEPIRLREEDSFASVADLPPAVARVFDQDTGNLRAQQEGFRAARKRGQTLSSYQEMRIRHMERAIDLYLSSDDADARAGSAQ